MVKMSPSDQTAGQKNSPMDWYEDCGDEITFQVGDTMSDGSTIQMVERIHPRAIPYKRNETICRLCWTLPVFPCFLCLFWFPAPYTKENTELERKNKALLVTDQSAKLHQNEYTRVGCQVCCATRTQQEETLEVGYEFLQDVTMGTSVVTCCECCDPGPILLFQSGIGGFFWQPFHVEEEELRETRRRILEYRDEFKKKRDGGGGGARGMAVLGSGGSEEGKTGEVRAFCGDCGETNENKTKFCASCGSNLQC